MIDKIMKIEDFKKLIEENKLNTKDLRICVRELPQSKEWTYISVTLTIPKCRISNIGNNPIILLCDIMKKSFFTYFLYDKNFTDFIECRDMVRQAYANAKELFGDIIEGYWSDDTEMER